MINFLRVEYSSFPLMTMETQQKCLHAKIYGFLSLLFGYDWGKIVRKNAV